MAQAKTWAAFDVHVSGVVAATLDRDSGELRVRRLAQKLSPVDVLIERSQQHVGDGIRVGIAAYASKPLLGTKIGGDRFVRSLWSGAPLLEQLPVTGQQLGVSKE